VLSTNLDYYIITPFDECSEPNDDADSHVESPQVSSLTLSVITPTTYHLSPCLLLFRQRIISHPVCYYSDNVSSLTLSVITPTTYHLSPCLLLLRQGIISHPVCYYSDKVSSHAVCYYSDKVSSLTLSVSLSVICSFCHSLSHLCCL